MKKPYRIQGNVLIPENGKPVWFPYQIAKVKVLGDVFRVELEVTGNRDIDAVWIAGIDHNGKKSWEFKRGIFGNKTPEVRFYIRGRRLKPEHWPKDALEMVFGEEKPAGPRKPAERITNYSFSKRTFKIRGCAPLKFDHNLSQVIPTSDGYVVALDSPDTANSKMGVFGVSAKGRVKWQFARPKDLEQKDSVTEIVSRGKHTVRVFCWSGWIFDIDPSTGAIKGSWIGR